MYNVKTVVKGQDGWLSHADFNDDGEKQCAQEHGGWVCTRPVRHDGAHAAHGIRDTQYATWDEVGVETLEAVSVPQLPLDKEQFEAIAEEVLDVLQRVEEAINPANPSTLEILHSGLNQMWSTRPDGIDIDEKVATIMLANRAELWVVDSDTAYALDATRYPILDGGGPNCK